MISFACLSVRLFLCGFSLEDRHLHPIWGFYSRIAIAPGHLFRVREYLRACLLQFSGSCFNILNLKGQTNWATHAPTYFHLVNEGRLRSIKEFEGGVRPKSQNHAAARSTLPLLDNSQSQAITVELDRLVKPLNRQDNTHFTDRIA
jgi:hypothetical protein